MKKLSCALSGFVLFCFIIIDGHLALGANPCKVTESNKRLNIKADSKLDERDVIRLQEMIAGNRKPKEIGDLNSDGKVDVLDLTILTSTLKSMGCLKCSSEGQNQKYDINEDGILNKKDIDRLNNCAVGNAKCSFGDLNGDGTVDVFDSTIEASQLRSLGCYH